MHRLANSANGDSIKKYPCRDTHSPSAGIYINAAREMLLWPRRALISINTNRIKPRRTDTMALCTERDKKYGRNKFYYTHGLPRAHNLYNKKINNYKSTRQSLSHEFDFQCTLLSRIVICIL